MMILDKTRYQQLALLLFVVAAVTVMSNWQNSSKSNHWHISLRRPAFRSVVSAVSPPKHDAKLGSKPLAERLQALFRSNASMTSDLDEFSDGECCEQAVVKSVFASREQVCRFRRSRSLLVRQPSTRPNKFGTSCLAYAHDISAVQPDYGVLVNVWNAGQKLRVVLTQLLKLTQGAWELIVLFDGCEDDSYQVAVDLLNRANSWPQCNYTTADISESKVWKQNGNWSVPQGDIGYECWLQNSSMVRVRFINTTKVGLHNTAGDNIKMLASRAKYLILMDDDQFMTVNGWNVKAAYPLQQWDDVFSASMRCAHNFPHIGGFAGSKCFNTYVLQHQPPAKCFFHVADSGNRGPLILRADYAKQLGYLDEVMFMGVVTNGYDDHDLNYRAYHEHGWVSGHIPVDYTEDRSRQKGFDRAGGVVADSLKELNKEMVMWFKARQAQYGPPGKQWNKTGGVQKQYRVIADADWHPACGLIS